MFGFELNSPDGSCTCPNTTTWIHHILQLWIVTSTTSFHTYTCWTVCNHAEHPKSMLHLNEQGKKEGKAVVYKICFSIVHVKIVPACTILLRRNSATQLGTGLNGRKATLIKFTTPERYRKAIKHRRTCCSKGARRKTPPHVAAQLQSCIQTVLLEQII